MVTKKLITKEILAYIREFNHVWMNKQPFYMIHARALFELILHRLLHAMYRQTSMLMDPRIKKLTAFIEEHYAEDLTLNDFADQLNLHPVYLGKLFKLNTGSTYKEYLQRVRVNNAEIMLATGNCTVTEAAECCGFMTFPISAKCSRNRKAILPLPLRGINRNRVPTRMALPEAALLIERGCGAAVMLDDPCSLFPNRINR